LEDQAGAGRERRLVGPFALGQGPGKEAAAGVADRRVVRPEPRCIFGHLGSSKKAKGSAPARPARSLMKEQGWASGGGDGGFGLLLPALPAAHARRGLAYRRIDVVGEAREIVGEERRQP